MPWSRDLDSISSGYIILTLILILILTSSFVFKQTCNIFHPKILHASFLVSNLPYTDFDIISYISALAFFREVVLRILRN